MPSYNTPHKDRSKGPLKVKAGHGTNWCYDAAYHGQLEDVEPGLVQMPFLLLRANDGKNAFHAACSNNKIDKFPSEFLTDQGLTSTDYDGNTCYHLLAFNGKLNHLPKEKTTYNALTIKNKGGYTSFHSGAANGKLGEIFSLGLIIERGVLAEIENKEKMTPLHLCARTKSLNSVPEDYLDHELMSKEDIYGNTTYHIAAQNSCLDQIPKELLTEEVLTKKNNANLCLLDYEPEQLRDLLKSFQPQSLRRFLNCVQTLESRKAIKKEILMKETKDLYETISL